MDEKTMDVSDIQPLHDKSNPLTRTIHVGAEPIPKTFDVITSACYYMVDLRSSRSRTQPMGRYHMQLSSATNEYRHFPMQSGWVAPDSTTETFVEECVYEMKRYPERKWYIHCRAGIGRTSVIACILLSRLYGWDAPTSLVYFQSRLQTRRLYNPIIPVPETTSQIRQLFTLGGNPTGALVPDRSDTSWIRQRKQDKEKKKHKRKTAAEPATTPSTKRHKSKRYFHV